MSSAILFSWDSFFLLLLCAVIFCIVLYGLLEFLDYISERCKRSKIVPIANVVYVSREQEQILNIQQAYVVH